MAFLLFLRLAAVHGKMPHVCEPRCVFCPVHARAKMMFLDYTVFYLYTILACFTFYIF